jgi:hypothetical protein
MDFQLVEYDNLLTLAYSLNQPQLGEAVNDAKLRTLTMKRKYEELFTAESSSNKKNTSVPPPTSTATTTVDRNNNIYEEAMKFVAKFKQKKVEEGKRMGWVACLKEGKDLNIQ